MVDIPSFLSLDPYSVLSLYILNNHFVLIVNEALIGSSSSFKRLIFCDPKQSKLLAKGLVRPQRRILSIVSEADFVMSSEIPPVGAPDPT